MNPQELRKEGTMTRQPGDVLDYIPRERWCREGTAIVLENGRAADTYWSSERHILNEDELKTAGLRFRLSDFRQIPSQDEWMTYAPADRQVITAQHGLHRTYYVRIGAEPDLETQIANARDRLAQAEAEIATAMRRAEWRREDLAKLEAEKRVA